MFDVDPDVLQRLTLPSQLHWLLAQTLPFWLPQLFPQPPQFAALAVTSVSQPSSALLVGRKQLSNPRWHDDVHAFAVHWRLAT